MWWHSVCALAIKERRWPSHTTCNIPEWDIAGMRWCNIQSLRKAQSKLNLRFSATQFEAELEYHFHPGPPSAAPNCSRTFAPSLISRDLLLPSPRLSPPLVFLRGGSPPLRSPRRSLSSVHLSLACSLLCPLYHQSNPLPPTRCQSPLGKSPV